MGLHYVIFRSTIADSIFNYFFEGFRGPAGVGGPIQKYKNHQKHFTPPTLTAADTDTIYTVGDSSPSSFELGRRTADTVTWLGGSEDETSMDFLHPPPLSGSNGGRMEWG